jgi:serine/threonine-protein kinase RsbT
MAVVVRTERMPLRASEDIVRARQLVRLWCVEQGFSLVDQTKLVTAASELARNTVEHGGGGEVRVEMLHEGIRRGVRLTFVDEGKGISDIALAMRDGYTTGSGLGLGLSGAKRLSNEFEIDSHPGKGTRVSIVRWR